jgi:hypothetical protein
MALLEGEEVAGLVVRRTGNPAAEEDADPFECQGTDGGVVGGAFGAVAVVASPGPEGAGNGFGGPLDEGLEEFGADPAPMDPMLVPAALGDGRNAREHLQGSCVGEAALSEVRGRSVRMASMRLSMMGCWRTGLGPLAAVGTYRRVGAEGELHAGLEGGLEGALLPASVARDFAITSAGAPLRPRRRDRASVCTRAPSDALHQRAFKL